VKVAVMTLTRDRLAYTQHCFTTLRWLAGCDFDHYVLDQGSHDGTSMWLTLQSEEFAGLILEDENVGCTVGWNKLLDLFDPSTYDVVVTFDNDCEVIQMNTLSVVASLAANHSTILAPRVDGLLHPPPAISRFDFDGYEIEETTILGNIFMAIPAEIFSLDGFRWDESSFALWDGGESITPWYRGRGGKCGYVSSYRVNHYKTTLGQVDDIPWYFRRRVLEGGRAQ
jgi:hypothetical protein